MSRSISASIKTGRLLASRAVHVIIEPQPRTIHERCQVLHILKDFGEIVMFRSLRLEPLNPAPNSILAIYQTPESASKLLAASPLRFIAELPNPQPLVTSAASFGVSHVFDNQRSSKIVHREDNSEPMHQSDNLPLSPTLREFHLRVDKSFADHQSHIARQEYYWGFVRNTKYAAHEQLSKSVPLEGLASISTNQTPLHNRLVQKNLDEVAQRKSLRQLWEEGRNVHRTEPNEAP